MKTGSILCVVFLFASFLNAEEKAWKEHVEMSYVRTSGNTRTETFSTKLAVERAGDANRYILNGKYLFSKFDGTESVNVLDSDFRYERVFTGRLFGFIGLAYVRDKYSGYDYRFSLGPGLGLDVVKTDNHDLKFMLSSMYYFDKYTSGDVSKNDYATVKVEIHYEWRIRENLTFQTKDEYFVSLEETDSYFIQGEAGIKVNISKALALGVSYSVK